MLFLRALSVFLGTIIGVGMFSLPFVASRAGFFIVFLYFLFMASIVILTHFLYSEVILGTEKVHRLPGYVGQYLNKNWEKATFFIIAVGLIGALLAYLVIGGEFLGFLLIPYLGGNTILYTLLFFIVGAYLLFRGIKSISQVELFLLVILFLLLSFFFIKAFPLINIDYLKTVDLWLFAFPYGVILFSLWGGSVIPEIKEIFNRNLKNKDKIRLNLKRVIFWGIIITVIIYFLFTFTVLGVSGADTSKEAISGLKYILGNNIIKLGFMFGTITCFTSFLTLGLTLKKTLWYDFGFSKNFSWFITCFLPLLFFLLGMREFIRIIGFTGAIAIGLEGIIIILLYKEFLKKKFSKKINPAFYLLTGVFSLGIIFETVYFFFFL